MASKVVNHELNKYVLPFNRISVDNQKIRGLTKPMKRIFFKGFKKPQTRKTWSSKKLGTLVHSQVEKVIKKRKILDYIEFLNDSQWWPKERLLDYQWEAFVL